METKTVMKSNILIAVITIIIVAVILIWAKVNVFDATQGQKQQTDQEMTIVAKVVNTFYTVENNYYIIVVEAGEEDVPENRIKIKVDEPLYKVGDTISVKTYEGKYYLDEESKTIEQGR